jgi:signal transduction histidine kinase
MTDQSVAIDTPAHREKRRQAIDANFSTVGLPDLAHHLQRAREDERGRLARALHDELGALLTAAKLDAAGIKSRIASVAPEALDRLAHLNETLNSVIALSRRIVEDLRPSSLDQLGLGPALETLACDFSSRADIHIDCELQPVSLSPQCRLTVFRLVQEALTNISKYAHAGLVHLTLTHHGDCAIVTVDDDGVGFDTGKPARGSYGLVGMRHRIEGDGGRLVIESTPGKGTRLSASLPLFRDRSSIDL